MQTYMFFLFYVEHLVCVLLFLKIINLLFWSPLQKIWFIDIDPCEMSWNSERKYLRFNSKLPFRFSLSTVSVDHSKLLCFLEAHCNSRVSSERDFTPTSNSKDDDPKWGKAHFRYLLYFAFCRRQPATEVAQDNCAVYIENGITEINQFKQVCEVQEWRLGRKDAPHLNQPSPIEGIFEGILPANSSWIGRKMKEFYMAINR